MREALTHLVQWYQGTLDAGGYPLIVLLMAIESTVFPIPSEVIIPFAAQRAHATGSLSMAGIVLAGTLGSYLGAAIMYWGSRVAGRPLVVRYGSYFLVPETKLVAAERWASRFGAFGVFVARLLPVVRHLIGIPMGIVKMSFAKYSIFTVVGAGLWCSVLTFVGVQAGKNEKLLQGDLRQITLWLAGAVVIIGALYYFFVHRYFAESASAKEL